MSPVVHKDPVDLMEQVPVARKKNLQVFKFCLVFFLLSDQQKNIWDRFVELIYTCKCAGERCSRKTVWPSASIG